MRKSEIIKKKKVDFKKELESLINRHSMENFSNTPILSEYLMNCLNAVEKIIDAREKWYCRNPGLAVEKIVGKYVDPSSK